MIVPETITSAFGREPGERPFDWDGEIDQEAMIEAFVVDVVDDSAHFVITHYDPTNDYQYSVNGGRHSDHYNSASLYKGWSSQFPKIYRDLIYMAQATQPTEIPEICLIDKAKLQPDSPELKPGDFIHIHHLILWEKPSEYGSKSGATILEMCKLPRPNEPVASFFERTAHLRPRIAKQLARTIVKRESMQMNARDRINPNDPIRPFEDMESTFTPTEGNSIRSHCFRSRNVFGSGPVEDHFVDITAVPAGDYYTELGGVQNYTTTGRHMFTPNVIPFGEGSVEDPLHVITVEIFSTTVFCPAIGEQRAYITIDGKKYELLQNHELSSSNFKQPGHEIIYKGVREEGVEKDTYEITAEQSDALIQRSRKEMQIAGMVVRQSYDNFFEGKGMDDSEILEQRIEDRIQTLRNEASEANNVIASIVGQEPIFRLPSGAHLLVPQSMLDSVEITLSGTE